jgi:hypothetical protein
MCVRFERGGGEMCVRFAWGEGKMCAWFVWDEGEMCVRFVRGKGTCRRESSSFRPSREKPAASASHVDSTCRGAQGQTTKSINSTTSISTPTSTSSETRSGDTTSGEAKSQLRGRSTARWTPSSIFFVFFVPILTGLVEKKGPTLWAGAAPAAGGQGRRAAAAAAARRSAARTCRVVRRKSVSKVDVESPKVDSGVGSVRAARRLSPAQREPTAAPHCTALEGAVQCGAARKTMKGVGRTLEADQGYSRGL